MAISLRVAEQYDHEQNHDENGWSATLLDGHNSIVQVKYQLLHTCRVINNSASDIITGRLELPTGHPIPHQELILVFEDGYKLNVLLGLKSMVTGTSVFYR
jgi:hypothetical protein